MEEVKKLLAEIFKDVPKVTDKTMSVRQDTVGGYKYHWENGVDVRVSIEQLLKIQEILNE